MPDVELCRAAYRELYRAMIEKDVPALEAVLDDTFVLIHMTGMRQPKRAFIRAVADGTLNYFSAVHEDVAVTVSGNTATLVGKSRVSAAVFGGGRHEWRLRQDLTLARRGEGWRITRSAAETY